MTRETTLGYRSRLLPDDVYDIKPEIVYKAPNNSASSIRLPPCSEIFNLSLEAQAIRSSAPGSTQRRGGIQPPFSRERSKAHRASQARNDYQTTLPRTSWSKDGPYSLECPRELAAPASANKNTNVRSSHSLYGQEHGFAQNTTSPLSIYTSSSGALSDTPSSSTLSTGPDGIGGPVKTRPIAKSPKAKRRSSLRKPAKRVNEMKEVGEGLTPVTHTLSERERRIGEDYLVTTIWYGHPKELRILCIKRGGELGSSTTNDRKYVSRNSAYLPSIIEHRVMRRVHGPIDYRRQPYQDIAKEELAKFKDEYERPGGIKEQIERDARLPIVERILPQLKREIPTRSLSPSPSLEMEMELDPSDHSSSRSGRSFSIASISQ